MTISKLKLPFNDLKIDFLGIASKWPLGGASASASVTRHGVACMTADTGTRTRMNEGAYSTTAEIQKVITITLQENLAG